MPTKNYLTFDQEVELRKVLPGFVVTDANTGTQRYYLDGEYLTEGQLATYLTATLGFPVTTGNLSGLRRELGIVMKRKRQPKPEPKPEASIGLILKTMDMAVATVDLMQQRIDVLERRIERLEGCSTRQSVLPGVLLS
jgi:uncharacterized small protein (DUF1192 family)